MENIAKATRLRELEDADCGFQRALYRRANHGDCHGKRKQEFESIDPSFERHMSGGSG
jgi:hypothetical protein